MTGKADPELITVKVTPDGEKYLKIVWYFTDGMEYVYCIHIKPLLKSSQNIRKLLENLVDERKRGAVATAEILFSLAREGYELYLALFAATSDAVAAEAIEGKLREISEDIGSHGRQYIIMFKVEDTLHIPWGLIYDTDPQEAQREEVPEPVLSSYSNFWCVKYDAAAINQKIVWHATQAIPEDYFRILSVVNRFAFKKAAKSLPRAERKNLIENVRSVRSTFEFRDPVFQKQKLFDFWKTNNDRVNFLCFYGHANEKILSLGPGEDVPMDDFLKRLKRAGATRERPGCMIFLNGCLTAVGRDGDGFLQVAGREGFCGFIGTETKIPDDFALRFGVEFVTKFLSKEQKVFEIMRALRSEYWPLSLTYSTCCHPLKYIKKMARSGAVFDSD